MADLSSKCHYLSLTSSSSSSPSLPSSPLSSHCQCVKSRHASTNFDRQWPSRQRTDTDTSLSWSTSRLKRSVWSSLRTATLTVATTLTTCSSVECYSARRTPRLQLPQTNLRDSKSVPTPPAFSNPAGSCSLELSQRLQSLLQNDDGEQDLFADDSLEAAKQLADISIYRTLSDEARRKAHSAVGKHGDEHSPVKATRTIRATVKETGSDSISTYIKSLGQHELLYKEDEVLLGRQVRFLTLLEEKRSQLETQLLRPPTFAQWAAVTNHTVPSLKQQIRRSQRAKAALIEANLRLVITVARQAVKKTSSTTSLQFQDACQQGIVGLTRATQTYNPDLGFRFSTYAYWWIQKEVDKNVQEQSWAMRIPPGARKKMNDISIQERVLMNQWGRRPTEEEVAEKVGMTVEKLRFYRQCAKEVQSLDKKMEGRTGKGSAAGNGGGEGGGGLTLESFVRDTEHPSPLELMDQQMMKEDVRRLIKTLSPREQAVIRLRFGLDDGKPCTLGDIGQKFGVEKERIKKIEARALVKLRQPCRSQVVKCYVSDHT